MPVLGVWIGIFILSLVVLIKSSDSFTKVAEKLGVHFRIPPFIVGVTIVSIGTSLPEIVSSVYAVIAGTPEIVVGNVVGSNIANILLILGVTAITAKNLKINFNMIRVDLPLFIASAMLLSVTIWDGVFTLPEALLCIAGVFIYFHYTVHAQKKYADKEIKKEMKSKMKDRKLSFSVFFQLAFSAIFIYLGAKYTVDSLVVIAGAFNIGSEIIAVSALALGTSLPELMVSVQAARNGKPEIAVGNILGSSIFNALGVMGIAGLFGVLPISNSILTFALPMMLIATLLYYFITEDNEITKWEGWFLILFYIFFIGKLLNVI